MRMLRVTELVLVLTLCSAVVTFAGPVTGSVAAPASDESGGGGTGGSTESSSSDDSSLAAGEALFDGMGLPLLRLSAPIYMQLGSRPKLRARGSGIAEEIPDTGSDMGNVISSSGLNLTDGLVIPGPFGDALTHPTAAPEPGAVLLVLPAIALLHRRLRARFSRS